MKLTHKNKEIAAKIAIVIFNTVAVRRVTEIVLATSAIQSTKAQTMNNFMIFNNIIAPCVVEFKIPLDKVIIQRTELHFQW